MDIGTFDVSADPTNDLFVYNNGTKSRFDSIEDIQEAAVHGIMSAVDDGLGGTALSSNTGGDAVTLTLESINPYGV